jgi:uncharacterized protein YbjT (DUF2867 family)
VERRPHAVLGATGYVGDELVRELLAQGEPVRALARTPAKARELERLGAEVRRADALEPETLVPALERAGTLYYLVHSMGRGADGDFAEREERTARNVAAAASEAGVELIVYLGGLGEGRSEHLRSRHRTAQLLREGSVPVTYARAAMVIGAGSESFRVVRHLVRRLPLMVTPRWVDTRTQPIAIADVVRYLAEIPSTPAVHGRELELGGADVTTYGGFMDAVADELGVGPRPRLRAPVLSPWLSSLWIGLVTPVDPGVARPLIEGLSTETVVRDPSGMALFGFRPAGLREAVRAALHSPGSSRLPVSCTS